MRSDSLSFAGANTAVSREPRFVVQILFSDSSPSFTSIAGLTGVPGDVYEETIAKISSISQQVWPEEGRTTIGSITVELVETIANDITAELRSQLLTLTPSDAESARDKRMRIYVGFSDNFADFQLVNTMFVSDVSFSNGTYRIQARDKTRALRTTILEPKETVLAAALSSSATTVTVGDTTDFEMVPHGTSFQDSPSATVGYCRIEDTGEIFRYTGKTSTTFTGVTRGAFGTRAQDVAFDPAESRDSWPKITEVIYLELPGPLAIIALLTGVINTSFPVPELPAHWHMGLDYAGDLNIPSFTSIGADLFDTSNYALGFPVRFIDPGATDGKAFVEKELCQLLGLYMFARSDGRLALRRMNSVLPENGFVAVLSAQNIVSHGDLRHDYGALMNSFRVNYNWTGEDFTRASLIVDSASAAAHGAGEQKVLEFKGLHTARHTERAIRDRIRVMRDRYAAPPLRLQVKADPTTNAIEIGDIVRVVLADMQDYTRNQSYLDRTFEVQRVAIDWVNGNVDFDLFASTTPPLEEGDNDSTSAALGDAWYTGTGTDVATLTGYIAGSPARLSANVTLTGSASDLRAAGSIWYHNGDLTIDSGVTVTVVNQAQLRVKGFLQLNGKIDGKGRGYAGAVDGDTIGAASTGFAKYGTAGYLGPTRSGDGIWIYSFDAYPTDQVINAPGVVVNGLAGGTSAPRIVLDVASGALVSGVPLKLQGTSGSSGGQVTLNHTSTYGTVRSKGGNGGASGAGLILIGRGLGFGPSGVIDLSGEDGTAGTSGSAPPVDVQSADGSPVYDVYPVSGGGGGGYPGTFYCLLDGDGVPYPDINSATFVANRGGTTITGVSAMGTYYFRGVTELRYSNDMPEFGGNPITGRNEYWQGPAANMWTVAHQVQYVPALPDAVETPVPAPASLSATGGLGQNALAWNWPIGVDVSAVEVFSATTNDRTFASRIATVAGGSFNDSIPLGGTRYYWVRSLGVDLRVSSWYPVSSTAGVSGTASAAVTQNPLTIRANKSTYTTTTAGSIYLHGFDSAGNPTDGKAQVNYNGVLVDVTNGGIATSQDVSEGWVIFDTSGGTPFTVSGSPKNYAGARKSRSGWVYDNGTAWTSFTATAAMIAVGSYQRASGSIVSVAALGNAMTMAAVPFEDATKVYAADIQPGEISDLAAFSSTLRPIKIVTSLPSLPSSSYPDGSTVMLTSGSVRQLYRATYATSPASWIKSVDGADLVAGTVEAAALAADLVLATLFRTAGSGKRVELEGGGHDFPFWVGSGTKGSVSGSPGSGAKVFYDEPADEFVVRGRLEASTIGSTEFDADDVNVFTVAAGSGRSAVPVTTHPFSGGSAALSTTYSTVATITDIWHPSASGTGGESNRLQHPEQGLQFDVSAWGENSAGSARTISFRLGYRYGSSGSYTYITTGIGNLSFTALAGDGVTGMQRACFTVKPAASWGGEYLLGMIIEANQSVGSNDVTVRVAGRVLISNLGNANNSSVTLT